MRRAEKNFIPASPTLAFLFLISLTASLFSFTSDYDQLAQGRLALQETNLRGAISNFDAAISMNANQGEAWFLKGIAHSYLEENTNALKAFLQAVKLQPKLAPYWMFLGLTQSRLSNYTKAVDSFKKSLEIYPFNKQAWNAKGAANLALNRVDESFYDFDYSLRIDSNFPATWYFLGNACEARSNYRVALDCYDRYLALTNDGSGFAKKGFVYFSMTNDALSISNLNIALSMETEPRRRAGLYNGLGAAFGRMRQFGKGLEALSNALRIDPEDPLTLDQMATTFHLIDQNETALAILGKALSIHPKNDRLWDRKASVELQIDAFTNALASVDKALALSPKDPRHLALKGAILSKLGRFGEAFSYLNRAQALDPKDDEIPESMALAYSRMGNQTLALKILDEILKKDRDDTSSNYNIACVYSLLGKRDKMFFYLRRAVELNPSYKRYAKKDPDFKAWWDHPIFVKIVAP